jgi:hypothetical protein
MNFGQMLQAEQSRSLGREGVIVEYFEWLASEGKPTEQALEFARTALSGERRDDLPRGFRASEATMCHRRRMLGYTKLFQRGPVDPQTQNNFDTGSFIHLKHQVAGLSAGYFASCEKSAINGLTRGYVDADKPSGVPVEVKSISSRGYRFVQKWGKVEHQHQVGHYAVARGQDYGILLYENKDTASLTEHLVEVDSIRQDMEDDVAVLADAIDRQILPPMKPGCIARDTTEWRYCPFREVCADARAEDVEQW